jgi:GDP-L-fucose synthase
MKGMQGYFFNKRTVVTGGAGFLGRYVVHRLANRGCSLLIVPRRASYDLRKWQDVCRLLDETSPDIVIHAAGVVAGIGRLSNNPAGSFYDNLMMGAQLLEAARQRQVSKVVILGTVCSYPKVVSIPTPEEQLWNGYPEETNAAYGLAKKTLLVQSQAYRQQYGLNSIYLISANLYGPGDNFDLETSHVIPALIRKFFDAVQNGDPQVTCWGDGTASREFLYVDDCAEGVLLATERYNGGEPVNLGASVEIRIRDLALLIADSVGFRGRIIWDASKPNGQPRRCWDTSRAQKAFGFRAKTKFEDGLAQTIAWYEQNFPREGQNEQSYVGQPQH